MIQFERYVYFLDPKSNNPAELYIKACRSARIALTVYGFDSDEYKVAQQEAVEEFRALNIREDHGKRLALTCLLSLLVLPAIYGAVQAALSYKETGHADYLFMTQTETSKKASLLFTSYSVPFDEELSAGVQ